MIPGFIGMLKLDNTFLNALIAEEFNEIEENMNLCLSPAHGDKSIVYYRSCRKKNFWGK